MLPLFPLLFKRKVSGSYFINSCKILQMMLGRVPISYSEPVNINLISDGIKKAFL